MNASYATEIGEAGDSGKMWAMSEPSVSSGAAGGGSGAELTRLIVVWGPFGPQRVTRNLHAIGDFLRFRISRLQSRGAIA